MCIDAHSNWRFSMTRTTVITVKDSCRYTFWMPVSLESAREVSFFAAGVRGVEASWPGEDRGYSRLEVVIFTNYWGVREYDQQLQAGQINEVLAAIWSHLVEKGIASGKMPNPVCDSVSRRSFAQMFHPIRNMRKPILPSEEEST